VLAPTAKPSPVQRTVRLADYLVVEPTPAGAGVVVESEDFSSLFRAEYLSLVRAFFLLTADAAEAEEIAQEAFARAFERWDRVSRMESPSGYVYRIGLNLNRHRLRHLGVRARRALAMRRDPVSDERPELRIEIAEAIASLTRGQREAFMLVEWLGVSVEDAARILRLAPASVRSRVHRARTTLRDRLDPQEEGTDG
jgi:RNA polymerase sigma-70 factor (ECF subfamily)